MNIIALLSVLNVLLVSLPSIGARESLAVAGHEGETLNLGAEWELKRLDKSQKQNVPLIVARIVTLGEKNQAHINYSLTPLEYLFNGIFDEKRPNRFTHAPKDFHYRPYVLLPIVPPIEFFALRNVRDGLVYIGNEFELLRGHNEKSRNLRAEFFSSILELNEGQRAAIRQLANTLPSTTLDEQLSEIYFLVGRALHENKERSILSECLLRFAYGYGNKAARFKLAAAIALGEKYLRDETYQLDIIKPLEAEVNKSETSPRAKRVLALAYDKRSENLDRARELLTLVADQNEDLMEKAAAQLSLGNFYRVGRGGEKNISKAIELLEAAMRQDVNPKAKARAQLRLGQIYQDEEPVKSIARASMFYLAAAYQDADLLTKGFAHYLRAKIALLSNDVQRKSEARALLERAVEIGRPVAMRRGEAGLAIYRAAALLGDMWFQGIGGPKDVDKAKSLFEYASEIIPDVTPSEEIRLAAMKLAEIYRDGAGTLKPSPSEAFALFRDISRHFKTGSDEWRVAMQNLGDMFRTGLGTEQNFRKARKYYSEAIEDGTNLEAKLRSMYGLAEMNRLGQGAPADVPKARELYEQILQEGGNDFANLMLDARLGLAFILSKPDMEPTEQKRARQWLEESWLFDRDQARKMASGALLAKMLYRQGAEKNYLRARNILETALASKQLSEPQSAEAEHLLALMLALGEGGDSDLPRAFELVTSAANKQTIEHDRALIDRDRFWIEKFARRQPTGAFKRKAKPDEELRKKHRH